ncbi:MAG: hypothetical protein ACXV8A_07670 [Chthoniobacterales bacterium]
MTNMLPAPRSCRFVISASICSLLLALTCVAQPPPPGQESTPQPAATGGDPIDFKNLLPIFPEAPSGWKAEDAEGSTEEMGDTQISTAHRDYSKGEATDAPTTSISILDSVASPDYVEMTTAGWKNSETTAEGYAKPVTIDGTPGFETFENEGKHGTLWLLVAKRYFLQIETTGQDPKELQEWLKRIDLKKLAALK